MIVLKARVTGADEVRAALLLMPAQFRARVGRAVQESAVDVVARTKEHLSDDVLHVRTGRLRRSIHYTMKDDGLTAQVGTNVEYAAVHEYGFHGEVEVREHVAHRGFNVKGRVIASFSKGARASKATAWVDEYTVRAHSRRMDMPERSFLRLSLAELEGSIRARIAKATAGVTL